MGLSFPRMFGASARQGATDIVVRATVGGLDEFDPAR